MRICLVITSGFGETTISAEESRERARGRERERERGEEMEKMSALETVCTG